jgi:hypothetical protein
MARVPLIGIIIYKRTENGFMKFMLRNAVNLGELPNQIGININENPREISIWEPQSQKPDATLVSPSLL